jgi:hypothetical protein
MIVRNPWLTELIWVRPFIATPCRVPRYKTTTSSSRLFVQRRLVHVSITMLLDQRLEWLWGAP